MNPACIDTTNFLGTVDRPNALMRSFVCKLSAMLAFDHPTLKLIAVHPGRFLFRPEPPAVTFSVRKEDKEIGGSFVHEGEGSLLADLNPCSRPT
jgi:hypothetical protein